MKKRSLFRVFASLVLILTVVMACQKSTANKPGKDSATREAGQKLIAWNSDVNKALNRARQEKKPVMMVFTASWCPSCRKMQDSTFTHTAVIERSGDFIPLRIDVDENPDIAESYNGNARKYGGVGIPNTLFLSPEGNNLRHTIGYLGPDRFLSLMDSVFHAIQ
jgi:thiol:disulfide interchange protein DsbD